MTKAPFMGTITLVARINDAVRAGKSRDVIRKEMHAFILSDAIPDAMPMISRRHLLEHAYKDAMPLDARDARAREKRAAFRAAHSVKPNVRGTTRAQDARSMLATLAQRHAMKGPNESPIGLPVDRSGFPPYHPNGHALVKQGLATLERQWRGIRSRLSVLHITEAGLAVAHEQRKTTTKQARKFA